MAATSDNRFDTHSGVQLLLEIAREHSVEPILQKIVEYAVERTEFVFAQVWLIEKGDLCATCKYRPLCPDQSRCLHLVAGRGRSLPGPGKEPQPYEDLNARMPLNFGPLGEAVASGQLKLIRSEGKQPAAPAGFEWSREEGILECGIRPIEFKGDVLGAAGVDPNLAAQLIVEVEISGHRSGTAERLTNSSCATTLMRASRHLRRVQLPPLLRGFGQAVRWYAKVECQPRSSQEVSISEARRPVSDSPARSLEINGGTNEPVKYSRE